MRFPLLSCSNWTYKTAFAGTSDSRTTRSFPLIRPGSFVEIDEHQDKVKPGNWQSEFDRPIYFVELRGGYACRGCELDGNQLILVPSPQSRGQIPGNFGTQPKRT